MESTRIASLRAMAEQRPEDPRPLFGLALEYEKTERWEEMVATLRSYLTLAADEGNAYGRLGRALHALGRTEEARAAYREGVEVANRHGHPTMAMDFEDALESL